MELEQVHCVAPQAARSSQKKTRSSRRSSNDLCSGSIFPTDQTHFSRSGRRRATLSQATAGFRGGQDREVFGQLTGSQSTQPSRRNYFDSPSSFQLRTPSPPRESDDYLAEIRTQLNKEAAEERAKSQAKLPALPPIPEGFSPEVFHAILDHLRATDLLRQGSSPSACRRLYS